MQGRLVNGKNLRIGEALLSYQQNHSITVYLTDWENPGKIAERFLIVAHLEADSCS